MSDIPIATIEDVNNNSIEDAAAPEAVVPQDEQQQKSMNDVLDVVFALESEKQTLYGKINALRRDLEDSLKERDQLKRKVNQLEQSLKQSVMLGGGADGPKSRQEQEELLLKAKTLLFEKTKVNKQQEQQIESLKNQVEAMKDVVQVTKDMLNLKTAECEHMQARLDKSQEWIKAEKDKCQLTEKKLDISKSVYDKLRAEYDIQAKIFKDLKEAYEQKIKVLTRALEEAKK